MRLEILLQADALLVDGLSGLLADIAVVPLLVGHAGQLLLLRRIAENKAVFPAVLLEPGVDGVDRAVEP